MIAGRLGKAVFLTGRDSSPLSPTPNHMERDYKTLAKAARDGRYLNQADFLLVQWQVLLKCFIRVKFARICNRRLNIGYWFFDCADRAQRGPDRDCASS